MPARAGMSHAEVSRIERGAAPWLSIVEASELVRGRRPRSLAPRLCGRRPARMRATSRCSGASSRASGPAFAFERRSRCPRVGDQRAWDATISDRSEAVGVEAETRLRDAQAFERRVASEATDACDDRVVDRRSPTRDGKSKRRCTRSDRPGGPDYPLEHRGDLLGADARPTASGRRGRRDLTRRPESPTRTPGSSGRSPSGRTSAGSTCSARARAGSGTTDRPGDAGRAAPGSRRARSAAATVTTCRVDVPPSTSTATSQIQASPSDARRQAMSSSVIGPPPSAGTRDTSTSSAARPRGVPPTG